MIVSHNIVALNNRASDDAAGLKAGPSGKDGHFFYEKGI